MFGVAFALGFAARNGYELSMDPWVGSEIFDIPNVTYCRDFPGNLPVASEHDFTTFLGADFAYRSYSQCQKCADYYSRQQLKSWFKIRPEIESKLTPNTLYPAAVHIRRGDFAGYSYPLVSRSSYAKAMENYDLGPAREVSDENPTIAPGLPPELDFLQDFYYLMTSRVILRANSSFSFWAAALSNALILSPEIAHLEGGREHAVTFHPGNGERLSGHDFVTPIWIKEI